MVRAAPVVPAVPGSSALRVTQAPRASRRPVESVVAVAVAVLVLTKQALVDLEVEGLVLYYHLLQLWEALVEVVGVVNPLL